MYEINQHKRICWVSEPKVSKEKGKTAKKGITIIVVLNAWLINLDQNVSIY